MRRDFDINLADLKRNTRPSFEAKTLVAHSRHIVFLASRLLQANSTEATEWRWSQRFDFVTCGSVDTAAQCQCDPVDSFNSTADGLCRPGLTQCKCTPQATGLDCTLCVDGNYRDYSRYQLGCLPCQCPSANFVGPCAWRHVGDPTTRATDAASASGGLDQRYCIGCRPGFVGPDCLPVGAGPMGLAAKVSVGMAGLLGLISLLAGFFILRRQCRRRAMRAARHSIAVQRLFSRFKDDTSLEAEAAEASAILTEDDSLQRATQQLRLGADPVYQPTTVSMT